MMEGAFNASLRGMRFLKGCSTPNTALHRTPAAEPQAVRPHKLVVCKERKSSMRHTRIIVTHYGGPDALRVVEEECPEPKNGEVRVRVLAAGVSLPDVMAREGVHPETPR